jgi:flagellar biosynthesis anti-sigma factor FlgM
MKIDANASTADPIVAPPGNNNDSTSTSHADHAGANNAAPSLDPANIRALTSQAMASPELRQDKVDVLRQAISSGHYKVEPDKVAEAMLQESPRTPAVSPQNANRVK